MDPVTAKAIALADIDPITREEYKTDAKEQAVITRVSFYELKHNFSIFTKF